MNSVDIVTMLGNLGQALGPIQRLVSGLAYIIGILFFIAAIQKLKVIGNARASSPSSVKMFVPIMYIVGGATLVFLPSAVDVLRNTAFGAGNVLQYANYNKYDIVIVITWLVRTDGLIWFVRGCVLLVHASEPGVQEGPKGLTFLIAGVLAMNFEGTAGAVQYILKSLIDLGQSIKSQIGY